LIKILTYLVSFYQLQSLYLRRLNSWQSPAVTC